MHKHRGVESFCRFPNNVERWMVEVATLAAVTMVIRIDVRADLDTAQAKLSDATLQFARGKIDILQGNCPEPCEVFWMSANNLRDVIIQHSRKIERVLRFSPIAKHHRHRREDLHRNPGAIHVFQAACGIPNVVGDLTEHTLANHHARAAFVTVLQSDESRVTVLFVQVRPVTRQNVSMEIDLHDIVVSAVSAECAEVSTSPTATASAVAFELSLRISCKCDVHRHSRNRASPG